MSRKIALVSAVSCLVISQAALVQTALADQAENYVHSENEVVVVRADPLRRAGRDVISNVAVVGGDALVQRRQATLGDTLAGVPGVASETFGGGASRPVIRGQTAPRVKVLSDGAGLADASDVSPDHAVTTEPLLLESIEILRGPSALVYGGGAIGGAVNLIDRKIPTALPEGGLDGQAEVRMGAVDDERAGVAGITIGAGAFALRLEGAQWRSEDYRVPFYTPSHAHHEDHEEEDEDHDHEEAEGFDFLAGSFNRSQTVTAGGSWIGSKGYLGVAFTDQSSVYGLPGHSHEYESCHPHGSSLHCGGHDHAEEDHDHEHEHGGEEVPVVDMRSQRWDVRGEWRNPLSGIETIRLRGGLTDYIHDEIDDGEVATTFTNKGHDVRIEAQHAPVAGFHGLIGIQSSDSDFATAGLERFIPASNTRNTAIFILEEYARGDWRFEGALRQEWQETTGVGRPDTEHTPFSASVSASWRFAPSYAVTASVGRSQRAPHVQELYARGIHMATNTYEIGTATLDEETANSIELTLKKTSGNTTFSASAYHYAYDGYIFGDTLDQYEDFRLIRYSQQDATFTGFEGQVHHEFSPGLSVTAFGDTVRARLAGGDNLPRIAPARVGLRADANRGPWSGSLEYIRVAKQDRISDYEVETPGYDMVNATVAFDVDVNGAKSQVFLRGSNLLDELALNHTSFLSTLAPLRGRNLVIGIRTQF